MNKTKHRVPHPSESEVLSKAIIKVKENLGLKQIELSGIVGSSTSEVSRLCSGDAFLSPDTKEGECALLLIRVYRSLGALLGEDPEQCQEWFKNYNAHLDAKPVELAKKVEGLAEIVSYLDTMRGLA